MGFQPYAYFDEGGKWQDKDFICLCGYLSTETGWEKFLSGWKQLMDRHQMPTGLHMTNFYSNAAQRAWDDAKTSAVLADYSKVIRENIVIGFAVGMDATHYRALPKQLKAGVPKPDTACLQRLLRMIRDRLRRENYAGRICVTFDWEEGAVVGAYQEVLRLRLANPDLARFIGAVSFADDEFALPLQAADMLANLTYRWFKDRMEGRADPQQMPDPLKSLILDPKTGFGLDYEQELWNGEALDKALQVFLGIGNATPVNPAS